jgi:hypothetical protein
MMTRRDARAIVLWCGMTPERNGVKKWMEDNDVLVYELRRESVALKRVGYHIT